MATVLIIDDSADLRTLYRMAIQSEGHTVMMAANGKQALDLLSDGAIPDLILVDLIMDVMDGETFVRTFKAQLPDKFTHAKIVAMTGADEPPEMEVTTVLKKPVGIEELLNTIRNLT